MRLTSAELTEWVDDFYLRQGMGWTWSKLSQDTEVKSITLSVQRKRNQIDAAIVIAAARRYNVNPIAELANIPRWAGMVNETGGYSKKELVTGMPPAVTYGEISRRLMGNGSSDIKLSVYPRALSVWIDVVGPDSARELLAQEIGVNDSSVSGRLNKTVKFPVDEIIDGFQCLGMSVPYALALSGVVKFSEIGISEEILENALASVDSEELMEVVSVQEKYIRRDLREKMVADEHLRRLG